jgi:hypothetical protein
VCLWRMQEGYVLVGSAVQEEPAVVVEDHHRGGGGAHLQAREEGVDAVADRCDSQGLARDCAGQQRDREQGAAHPQGPRQRFRSFLLDLLYAALESPALKQ